MRIDLRKIEQIDHQCPRADLHRSIQRKIREGVVLAWRDPCVTLSAGRTAAAAVVRRNN